MLLDGFRVVSLCHYLQGPAATQYLADMGADVIKVEPLTGAYERRWSGAKTFVGDVSGFFLCANRNKRSIALDLKSEAGKDVFLRIVETADAVVENFRPGVLDRLGLGHEKLKERKPEIIFASASGFGSSGPMKDKPGQDLLIQARSGLISATGNSDEAPTAVGCAAVDQHGAALLAMGIVAAYVRRLKRGKGTRVEASLFNAGIDLQMEPLTNYLSGAFGQEQFTRDKHLATWLHEAPYGVYRAKDAFVAISLNDPVQLAEALGDERLAELVGIDRYAERDRYAQAVAAAVRDLSLEELSQRFDKHALWYAPVQTYDQLSADPQAEHNQVFRKVPVDGGTATLVNHPLRYDGEVPRLRHLALRAGEDTEEVLGEIGLSKEQVRELADAGVVNLGDSR